MFEWLRSVSRYAINLFNTTPVFLIIVRKYVDANGNYVGELYLHEAPRNGVQTARMIGVSLDSMPFGIAYSLIGNGGTTLDLKHDFLAPMAADTLRVGAMDPAENDNVRRRVAKLNPRMMRISVQNRFCEEVLEGRRSVKR